MALPGSGGALGVQRRDGDGGRQAVQRHVDQSGYPASRRRTRRSQKAFPGSIAGLADMDMAVHQTRQQHLVRRQSHHHQRVWHIANWPDMGNPPVRDTYADVCLARRQDGARRNQRQIKSCHGKTSPVWTMARHAGPASSRQCGVRCARNPEAISCWRCDAPAPRRADRRPRQ